MPATYGGGTYGEGTYGGSGVTGGLPFEADLPTTLTLDELATELGLEERATTLTPETLATSLALEERVTTLLLDGDDV